MLLQKFFDKDLKKMNGSFFGSSLFHYLNYLVCLVFLVYYINTGILSDMINDSSIYNEDYGISSKSAEYFMVFFRDLFNFLHLPQSIGQFLFTCIFLFLVFRFLAPIISFLLVAVPSYIVYSLIRIIRLILKNWIPWILIPLIIIFLYHIYNTYF